jgi:hypothetical protein
MYLGIRNSHLYVSLDLSVAELLALIAYNKRQEKKKKIFICLVVLISHVVERLMIA